ncbi:hypothetical protein M5K25_014373 [Dendrobium thyrsiflorum]|uniref:Uncharacterized protein n=1 Tax=Dendrobium thyrsiflorum TaxID=117978 RepID=A0ABD0UW49_DENTH
MFSGGWMVMVARASADWSQSLACNPDRLTNDELLHLLLYLPLRHLRRFALCLFSFFCLPDPNPRRRQIRVYYYMSSSSSSSSDYSDEDEDSHSD